MGKSVAFFENGSWYHRTKVLNADYSVTYSKKGGFKNREDAEESYYECKRKFENDAYGNLVKIDSDISIKQYFIYWFEKIYSTRVESTTKMVGAYTIYNLIFPNLEVDIKLRFITAEYFNEILKKVKNSFSDVSANKAREIISIMLKDTYANQIITYNPIKEIDYYARNSKNIQILNKEQIKTLLEITSRDNWYLEILLGLFCGLRRGEIQGLKFADFDIEEETVTISRQLVSDYEFDETSEVKSFKIKDYTLEERDPKTINSYRRLRVPKVIIDQVNSRLKLKEYYQAKDENFKDNDYISFQPNGMPHGVNSLNGYLKRICKKRGLPHISVHSLRHMFATILLEQGVELTKISALLGHESIHTTFEFYCEVMEDDNRISAFMNNTFSPDCIEEGKVCNF